MNDPFLFEGGTSIDVPIGLGEPGDRAAVTGLDEFDERHPEATPQLGADEGTPPTSAVHTRLTNHPKQTRMNRILSLTGGARDAW